MRYILSLINTYRNEMIMMGPETKVITYLDDKGNYVEVFYRAIKNNLYSIYAYYKNNSNGKHDTSDSRICEKSELSIVFNQLAADFKVKAIA